ncbi:histidine phosphotransferase family protein [Jannaschia sp. W003]|uniref:histidine phosphotransferase family protein n=1 Tax=Jannaschia sp. W003 TaxID=2867012 RepID=UPI0021A8C8F1|nr:histidine phosphotransferase family protein [Jannaschia sp. W003]UWQ20591.1 histidine phosphotransferase [Jannaschia sp. W003]
MSDTRPSASDAAGQPDLAALLGSRICHDLAGPLGAVANGLELLEMAHGESEELALVRGAVDAGLARLRLFRLAFGAGGGDGPVPAREVSALLTSVYGDTRIEAAWRDAGDRPRAEMRLALLALLCVETAMPRGGRIEVRRDAEAWAIRAEAERLRIDHLLWEALGRAALPADLRGAEVQFGLLAAESRALRRPVSVEADERRLALVV